MIHDSSLTHELNTLNLVQNSLSGPDNLVHWVYLQKDSILFETEMGLVSRPYLNTKGLMVNHHIFIEVRWLYFLQMHGAEHLIEDTPHDAVVSLNIVTGEKDVTEWQSDLVLLTVIACTLQFNVVHGTLIARWVYHRP